MSIDLGQSKTSPYILSVLCLFCSYIHLPHVFIFTCAYSVFFCFHDQPHSEDHFSIRYIQLAVAWEHQDTNTFLDQREETFFVKTKYSEIYNKGMLQFFFSLERIPTRKLFYSSFHSGSNSNSTNFTTIQNWTLQPQYIYKKKKQAQKVHPLKWVKLNYFS